MVLQAHFLITEYWDCAVFFNFLTLPLNLVEEKKLSKQNLELSKNNIYELFKVILDNKPSFNKASMKIEISGTKVSERG